MKDPDTDRGKRLLCKDGVQLLSAVSLEDHLDVMAYARKLEEELAVDREFIVEVLKAMERWQPGGTVRELKAVLSGRDVEEIYRYAMKRSEEIKKGN